MEGHTPMDRDQSGASKPGNASETFLLPTPPPFCSMLRHIHLCVHMYVDTCVSSHIPPYTCTQPSKDFNLGLQSSAVQ